MTENINDKQDFFGHAEVTQDLKAIVELHLDKRDKQLAPDQRESLEMIFHEIGRIITPILSGVGDARHLIPCRAGDADVHLINGHRS
jgi:hypothetical protein